jgi:DNA-binding response OmpR family regulator
MGAFDYTLKPVDFAYLSRAVDTMMARAGARPAPGVGSTGPAAPSEHNLLNDLALGLFRATRALSPIARETLGRELEQVALAALQRGAVGDKQEVVRALNQVRTLLRFAKDLGDISDDAHRVLEAAVARARRSVGLS